MPVGVVEGHDGGDGAHVLHGMHVGRQPVHDVEHGFRERVLAAQVVGQLVELGLARQPTVPQQVHDFLEGRVLRQIFDHVAAIGQRRSHDRAQFRGKRDDPFKTFLHFHCVPLPSLWVADPCGMRTNVSVA